ncbi:MAG: PEP-CTERM sorting domain-containing protein [Candidatus Sulfotelmatobacter sp.]
MPNPGAAWSAANGAFDMRAIEQVALPNLKRNISLQPSTATCLLISSCSNLVEVPEPPSSLLLGTGLLFTASMFRHRLLSRV